MTGLGSTAVKFTIFGVVALSLFVGLLKMMGNQTNGDTREWTARFEVVSGLRAGDDVRVAGVKVGRVDGVEVVDNDQARVRFSLQADQVVYDNTLVTLRYQNLLGQRYLALTVPSGAARGEELTPDEEIPISRTSPGFDLTTLLNGFEPLFAVLEPAEVNELAGTIVAVLQGESGTVESLLRRTSEATTYLASRDELFGEVLDNLVPVLENLDDQSTEFDATVVQLRRLMTGLAGERETFADSIDHLGGLVESTSDLLSDIREPFARDVSGLRRLSRVLAANSGRLADALRNAPILVAGFARSMSWGAYLNVYLCNLSFEVLGADVWLGGPAGPYSEACR